MVYDGPEIFDADDDMKVVFLGFKALELLPLNSNGCVKGFLQYLFK